MVSKRSTNSGLPFTFLNNAIFFMSFVGVKGLEYFGFVVAGLVCVAIKDPTLTGYG